MTVMFGSGQNNFAVQAEHCPVPKSATKMRRTDGAQTQSAFREELQQAMGPRPEGTQTRIAQAVRVASKKHGVPQNLIKAVIKQESAFNPQATSHCGAQGLMQLMPGTAKELGVKDSYNIEQNIDGGAKYLSQMLRMFKGDVKKSLAAYNAGPGNVKKHGGIPPFAETQNYVKRITASLDKGVVHIPGNLPAAPTPAPAGPIPETLVALRQAQPDHAPQLHADSAISSAISESALAETLSSNMLNENIVQDIVENSRQALDNSESKPLPSHAILV